MWLINPRCTEGKHVPEINRENPLGMRGQIADEYAALVNQLWSGQASAVAPRDFKVWQMLRNN